MFLRRISQIAMLAIVAIAVQSTSAILHAEQKLKLQLLDGRSVHGVFEAYQQNNLLVGGQAYPLSSLLAVEKTVDTSLVPSVNDAVLLHLNASEGLSQLVIGKHSLSEQQFSGQLSINEYELKVPAKFVRRISWYRSLGQKMTLPAWIQAQTQALNRFSKEKASDELIVVKNKKVQRVSAVFQSLADQKLSILLGGKVRSIHTKNLAAINLSVPPEQLSAKAPKTGTQLVRAKLVTGESVDGELLVWTAEEVRLKVPAWASEIVLPTSHLQRLEIINQNLRFVSSLEPVSSRERAILAPDMPYKMDSDLLGRPINVAGKEYVRGISQHADSELTFQKPDAFNWLVSRVGLNASGLKGDCLVRVLGDGQVIWQRRLHVSQVNILERQKQEVTHWYDIKLPIGSYSQISLQVEHGENWDMSDHVSWAMVRFIRS